MQHQASLVSVVVNARMQHMMRVPNIDGFQISYMLCRCFK